MKTCTKCKKHKDLSEYRFVKATGRYRTDCKACHSKQRSEHYIKNRDRLLKISNDYKKKNLDRIRNREFKKLYGIDIESYNKMLTKQENKCMICKASPESKRLEVDHNHVTKKVRGLLCHKCNKALGLLNADLGTELLIKAINYIGDNYV